MRGRVHPRAEIGRLAIVTSTLRRGGITITTFMVTQDPYLMRFVDQLSAISSGAGYFPPDSLRQFFLMDSIMNRRLLLH